MIIEVIVTSDETVEKIVFFFQKVAGVILDFLATIGGHGNGFFRRRKCFEKIGFSTCRSELSRGPNRRILRQGIGQNFNRTIFEKVKKIMFCQLL